MFLCATIEMDVELFCAHGRVRAHGKGETREKIVSAATQILLKENVAALNIENICQHAGITKKSFCYHFESKDQLLEAIMAGLQPNYAEAFEAWASEAGPGATLHEQMQALSKPWRVNQPVQAGRDSVSLSWRRNSEICRAIPRASSPLKPTAVLKRGSPQI